MSIYYDKMTRMIRFDQLSRCESRQAEAIANHYNAHALIAKQLQAAVEIRKQYYGDHKELDDLITHLTDQIKKGHALDFGIELNWNVKDGE